jgi:hypothetical protein
MTRAGLVFALALSAGGAWPSAAGAAPAPSGFADPGLQADPPAAEPRVPSRPTARLAAKSHLPYPDGAEIWVDAEGAPQGAIVGLAARTIQRVAVLVFRPREDDFNWTALLALYAQHKWIEPGARPEASALDVPTEAGVIGPVGRGEEVRAYRTETVDRRVVLGFIRALPSRDLLAYAVVMDSKLSGFRAMAQGRSIVTELVDEAGKLRRQAIAGAPLSSGARPPTLPLPAGAMPIRGVSWVQGPGLQQLLSSIEQSVDVSARVKEMARQVIPQARLVTFSSWRVPRSMTDTDFVAFYAQAAMKLGWGAPVSQDPTPGRPTLLFRRPGGEGVVMVRAQPGPVLSLNRTTSPSTEIYVLSIEARGK